MQALFTAEELEASLGSLRVTAAGWQKRDGSVFDLLEESPPPRVREADLTPELAVTPLLITRADGVPRAAAKPSPATHAISK